MFCRAQHLTNIKEALEISDISDQLLDISHQSSHQLLDNYLQDNKTQCRYRLKNNILKTK